MNCTHPVIYTINGAPTCYICGAVLTPIKDEPPKDETPKPAKKGKRIKAD